ncbi:hypothetical protein K435DRAFT_788831 [Dendrothele bispora CBS 962.96]|uniref:DUF6533 domain-containing protein n=1 Tax=Dendrothele bispora (strain CBS 962.96) TaxID=1314807 RepID=A0A4V4HIL5_DENBC|nr:hypothetical protein K435DRAFT_788831 [Dendrothele bispora CBS 962.96]
MTSSADLCAVAGTQDELIYDFLISLDAEIQLVWKAPWKFGKLLYFLTRYLPFVGAIVTIHLNRSRFTSLGTCKALSEATASEDFYESIIYNQLGLCPLLFGNSNDTIMLLVYLMIYETSVFDHSDWSIWGSQTLFGYTLVHHYTIFLLWQAQLQI